jgi:histidine triad (HIT) family protein
MDCIFCKIIKGEIPAEKLYEDNECIVIKDIKPAAKKHFLLIPKEHYKYIAGIDDNQAGQLIKCLRKFDKLIPLLGLEKGYRLVINQGDDAQQSVPHLHIHILSGQKMGWTPA